MEIEGIEVRSDGWGAVVIAGVIAEIFCVAVMSALIFENSVAPEFVGP
jgi:hypothetical protein